MIKKFVLLFNKHFVNKKYIFCRSLSSAKEQPNSSLFVSGKRASDTFIVVTPHINFNERFNEITLLEENLKRRGLNIDVSRMKDLWNFYNDWNTKKIKLEENVEEIGKKLTMYIKMEDSEEKKVEMEKLHRYLHLVKEDLSQVKKNVWDMEDSIIPELLKIPNNLHAESPEQEEELFSFQQENVISKGVDHLVMGKKLNYVEYRNGLTCFLKGKAALFELAVAEFFIDSFSKENFIRFSNPDLMRSVLAEGVGLAPCDSSEVFLLEQTEGNNHLQLCGGASLFPFCAFHAKHTVSKQALPVRYVAAGRQFTPYSNSLCGLYSVNQSTCVQMFTASSGEEEVDREFQYCVKKVCEVYSALGLNFKVVRQTPRSYKSWESLRASIRVFSPFHQDFVEVGSVSLLDDYVSKRLRMYYTDKTNEMFLKVVSGTVINTQTLLALCLERSNTDLFIPECVRRFLLV